MKWTRRKVIFTTAGGMALVWMIALLAADVLAIRGVPTTTVAIILPATGEVVSLATQLNPNGTRIAVITDANSQIVFSGSMRFSDNSRWFVYGSAGELWIYSGDIGILRYARDSDGQWSEQTWVVSLATSRKPRAFYSQLPDSSRKSIDLNFVGP